MRFELIGKHKSKLVNVGILALKMGQTDLLPAVSPFPTSATTQ